MTKGTQRIEGLRPLCFRVGVAFVLSMAAGAAPASDAGPHERSGATLRAAFDALKADPGHGQFGRPLYLDSTEGANDVSGEIHALVDHSFATTTSALVKPAHWCDVLILHLNVKYCRPANTGRGSVLQVSIGRKHDQPIDEAHRLNFAFRVVAETAAFLQVWLHADEGPFGTRDYRIVFEATPADDGRTVIRLSYSYAYGMAGRLAMQAYLGTLGRDKVGFTVVGRSSGGEPRFVGGMRGVAERNAMRYYLAIESFLGARASPAPARMEKSLRDWFAASERHPRQLHEMGQGEYLAMKRKEYLRQQPPVLITGPGAR